MPPMPWRIARYCPAAQRTYADFVERLSATDDRHVSRERHRFLYFVKM